MSGIRTNADSLYPVMPLSRTPPQVIASTAALSSLQETAEAFYSWYLYRSSPKDQSAKEGRRHLECIMQIAEKQTPTPEESKNAIKKLSLLIEKLDGGKKALDDIPGALQNILNHLVENNFQSRIRMQVTRIEMAINSARTSFSKQEEESYKDLLKKIKPEMSKFQALEISRLLEQFKTSSSDSSWKDKSIYQIN